ncbi:MAG: PDZ domain-containing protein [Chloroflexi bacterium]|nr:PDZ domain-containing protein [Chloroflexota bacterium]
MKKALAFFLILVFMLTLWGPVSAQDGGQTPPPAVIENDEGGPVIIEGEYDYSDPDMPNYGSQPVIFLGDVSNLFVEGGFDFSTEYLNLDSPQVLGYNTTSIFDGPLAYEIALPIEPPGVLTDVDNDAEQEPGVMIYTVNFTFNGIDDPFIDHREFIYYSSVTSSQAFETQYQLNGGKFIVYAPAEGQGFPSGFGDDAKLFTEDDPIVTLPQGWTIVDMDSDPFTFDRSHVGQVDIVESEGTEYVDFSEMGYTEAFDAMIEMMRDKYAFTELKGVDWDALVAEFRPRIEEAEKNEDDSAYYHALLDFNFSIPDGHVYIDALSYMYDEFLTETGGGLGMAIRELDDGRTLVNFVLPDGPAEQAGIELRAEILSVDGQPAADYVSSVMAWSGPFSAPHDERLQKLRYAFRSPVGTAFEITYQNPGAAEPTTVSLTTVEERDSLRFSSYGQGLTGFELPLEFTVLDSGYGYIKIYSFDDDNHLSLLLWQRAMRAFIEAGVPGLVIDMRQNGGGSPDIGNVMLGYFFDEETYTGTSAFYYEDLDRFEIDPLYAQTIIPAPEMDRYYGDIAVIVGPGCASMCEFFSYTLTLLDNTSIIGHYPTAGLGGGIESFSMPGGMYAQYTIGRGLGADNEIHIEGTGVAPDIHVPVDEETLFAEGDVLLDAAVAHLDEVMAGE